MSTTQTGIEAPRQATHAAVAIGLALAAVAASLGNAVVAALAHAAGASDGFRPLELGTFVPLTVVGIVLGAVGWSVVGRTRRGPSTLRWLVPLVLALSFVPDLLVGITDAQPHTSWTGVLGLMAMHLVVAAVALPVYARILPARGPR